MTEGTVVRAGKYQCISTDASWTWIVMQSYVLTRIEGFIFFLESFFSVDRGSYSEVY